MEKGLETIARGQSSWPTGRSCTSSSWRDTSWLGDVARHARPRASPGRRRTSTASTRTASSCSRAACGSCSPTESRRCRGNAGCRCLPASSTVRHAVDATCGSSTSTRPRRATAASSATACRARRSSLRPARAAATGRRSDPHVVARERYGGGGSVDRPRACESALLAERRRSARGAGIVEYTATASVGPEPAAARPPPPRSTRSSCSRARSRSPSASALDAHPGTLVVVPPRVVHSFENEGPSRPLPQPPRAACGFGDYLRGLHPGFDQHDLRGQRRAAWSDRSPTGDRPRSSPTPMAIALGPVRASGREQRDQADRPSSRRVRDRARWRHAARLQSVHSKVVAGLEGGLDHRVGDETAREEALAGSPVSTSFDHGTGRQMTATRGSPVPWLATRRRTSRTRLLRARDV